MSGPLSMTAFGRGESEGGGKTWTVEIRSVNHRFCDLNIKMPRQYGALEERIKKETAKSYARGHVDVMINCTGAQAESGALQANLELARQYHQCLKTIQQDLSLGGEPDIAMLASFKDIIVPVEIEEDIDTVWEAVRAALGEALESCGQMRQNEGQALKKDLLERVHRFAATVESIVQACPDVLREKAAAFKERLDNLLKGVDIDPVRLAQEVAVMADKSDVTEEIVRLRSHISQFINFLEIAEPVGRRLDFLLQEFLREVNTLASKIGNGAIAHLTVDLKNELEKMREQVQNLE